MSSFNNSSNTNLSLFLLLLLLLILLWPPNHAIDKHFVLLMFSICWKSDLTDTALYFV